jgi:predicted dithiol-disulfide oxidoreductase (DUF899 family)
MSLPEIVSEREWQQARDALLAREKEATRARDALAAERRRLPMTEIPTGYRFLGPDGEVGMLDLFEGRSQLVLYHFWMPAGEEACNGCSMMVDQFGHLAHIHARGVSVALVSTAPQDQIAAFKERMGWDVPWYTVVGTSFQEACGTTEWFALDVYLRDGDRAFLTYRTRGRGVETLGPVWSFLDLTPMGRQEDWEDTPEGRPQGPRYQWWRKHDSYEDQAGATDAM